MKNYRYWVKFIAVPTVAASLLLSGCSSANQNVPSADNSVTNVTPNNPGSATDPSPNSTPDQNSTQTPAVDPKSTFTGQNGRTCTVTDPDSLKQWGAERSGKGLCTAIKLATAAFTSTIVLGHTPRSTAPLTSADFLGPVRPYVDTKVLAFLSAKPEQRDTLVYGPTFHAGATVTATDPPIISLLGVQKATAGINSRLEVTVGVYDRMTFDVGGNTTLASTQGQHTIFRVWNFYMTESLKDQTWLMTDFTLNPNTPDHFDQFDALIPASVQQR